MLDELCAQGKAEVDNKGRYSKVSGKRRDRRKNKEALKAEKPERGRKEENAERRIMRNIVSPRRTEPSWRELYWPLQGLWICGSGGSGTGYFYSGK